METGTSFKIDVFTPTLRHDGLKIVGKCLERQTFKNFRWVIVDEDYSLKWASENLSKNLDIIYLPAKIQSPKRKYRIMNARNTPIPFFDAPLIVELQDYHWFPVHTLEKFKEIYFRDPMALVSAYYSIVTFHNYEKAMESDVLMDEDVEIIDRTCRYDPSLKGDYLIVAPEYSGYEMNISSIPLAILKAISPLEESLDDGYQSDPHYIAMKAMEIGCHIVVALCLKGYSFEHKLFEGRPDGWQDDSKINQDKLRSLFGKNYWGPNEYAEFRIRQETH